MISLWTIYETPNGPAKRLAFFATGWNRFPATYATPTSGARQQCCLSKGLRKESSRLRNGLLAVQGKKGKKTFQLEVEFQLVQTPPVLLSLYSRELRVLKC